MLRKTWFFYCVALTNSDALAFAMRTNDLLCLLCIFRSSGCFPLKELQMHQIQDFEDQAIGAGLLSMNTVMFDDNAQVIHSS